MKGDISSKLKKFFLQYSIATVLIVIIITLCLIDSTLVSVRNIRNIVSDAAPITLMVIGMAICLYSGFIDLSAGSIATLSGILAGSLVQRVDTAGKVLSFLPTIPAFVVIPLIVALFYALGYFYGLFLYKTKLPSWFITLAVSSIFMGIGYIYLSSPDSSIYQISGFSNQFLQFGIGYIGSGPTHSVPYSIIISVIVLIGLWIYLKHYKLDFKTLTTSLEKRNTKANVAKLFACSTALFSLAGIMITARNGIATPSIGFGLTSDAIAICLIASFSLRGKKGKYRSAIIAAFIYTSLVYCITFIGINQYTSLILRGIILICAVLLEKHIEDKEKALTE